MHSIGKFAIGLVALMSIAPLARTSSAQTYASNSAGGEVRRLVFTPDGFGFTELVNGDANQRTKLASLVTAKNDTTGQIDVIVADTQDGKVLLYADVEGGGLVDGTTIESLSSPDGLSKDPALNLFLITSGPGGASAKQRNVFVIPRSGSGWGHAKNIDTNVKVNGVDVDLLADTKFVTFSSGRLAAGDLLVATQDPPAILRYNRGDIEDIIEGSKTDDADPSVFVPTSPHLTGSAVGGIAFAPDGNLLVSTNGGDILRFDANGSRVTPDFATGLGNGKIKIAVGPDPSDGENRVLVTDNNGGDVLRFTILPDGMGSLENTVTSGLQSPDGVDTVTSDVAPTPAGSNITVLASSAFESTWQQVEFPGVTDADVFLLQDLRNGVAGSLFLSAYAPGLVLPEAEIPDHVRPSADNTFILVIVETTARPEVGTIIDHVTEQNLVPPGPCPDGRFFFTPNLDANEAPLPEGNVFIDVTTDCTNPRRGATSGTSLFLVDAQDTRSLTTIAETKLDALREAVNFYSCISRKTRRRLGREVASAIRHFDRGRFDRATNALNEFIALIDDNAGSFGGCDPATDGNVSGQLKARALSAIYFLGLL